MDGETLGVVTKEAPSTALAERSAPIVDVAALAHSAGSPPMAPSPKPAEVLGDILWLMSQSPTHKNLRLADTEWLVLPAIQNHQFRLFCLENRPFAFVSWALLTEGVAQRMAQGGARLSPSEWNSGEQAWLVDVVAPFGGVEGVVKQVKAQLFRDRALYGIGA